MTYFEHPLIIPQTIEARKYQINILKTAIEKNTLCVIGTGLGKTPISVMLAADRLDKYPDSKILICAPTRPLNAQHEKTFRKFFDLPKNNILLVTGKIPPENRKEYYREGKIIAATPQTIGNDVRNGILNLSDFSLLVIDETQHAVGKYAYPYVAKMYMKQSKFPRILGLTASPGSSKEKIDEICRNLYIDAVEIRTETDPDVAQYVQETKVERIDVELTDEMKEIQENIKRVLNDNLKDLRGRGVNVRTKGDLIKAQGKYQGLLRKEKIPIYFHIISKAAETVKLWHALELLETQSIQSVKLYFERLKGKTDRSSNNVIKKLTNVIKKLDYIKEEHPKIIMLRILVRKYLKDDPNCKIIIFSHFRDNIDKIRSELEKIEGCKPAILIGQAGERGLKQKQQIEVIKDYEAYVYNCLITSPVGEEGLNLVGSDIAIFYEPVSSEIRSLQRRGRVGRFKSGKVIILVTKKTRDEANFYISKRKEEKMKGILRDMQEKTNDSGNLLW